MDKIEALYKPEITDTIRFGISVPRASYITHAFTEFVNSLDSSKRLSIDFRETNSMDTINNVCDSTSSLGVIRYDMDNEEYFMSLLNEKNLKHELILEFEYRVLMSADDPLADCDISADSLADHIELTHGDYEVPYISSEYTKRNGDKCPKRIYVYERGSQFDLLTDVRGTYMWVSPMPSGILSRLNLVQKKCTGNSVRYADVLIYQPSYKLTEYDSEFISRLYKIRDEVARSMNV